MNLLLISVFLVLSSHVVIAQNEIVFRTGVRDLTIGKTIPSIEVAIYRRNEKKCEYDDKWIHVASNVTNENGASLDLVTATQFPVGVYKLIFQTGKYYEAKKVSKFYPYLEIIFKKSTPDVVTVVVSLSPYGYSFYKGEYAPH